MVFEKEYFEDEVRDGFYVPAQMKHAWAAQLEVLNDIDKACTENEIQFCRMGNPAWCSKASRIHTMG